MTSTSDWLQAARKVRSQGALAEQLGVTTRQVRRWEIGSTPPPARIVEQLKVILNHGEQRQGHFTFADLFAGLGGMRLAFESVGGTCVFTSEIDRYAQMTYTANFVSNHLIHGDIRKVHEDAVPDHDVLLAGFPCQTFSTAGRREGFACETRGTLFFDVARIIKAKRPKAFLLENVKGLLTHDKGRTMQVIRKTLLDLGYYLHIRVIDAASEVPQHRERVLIVGFRDPTRYKWPVFEGHHTLSEILEPVVAAKYTMPDALWAYHLNRVVPKSDGFGYKIVSPDGVAPTLTANYHKDGAGILIAQEGNPRRLTPRECARLMGYPDSFKIPVSDARAYKQFGNSVVLPVIRKIASAMMLENKVFQPACIK